VLRVLPPDVQGRRVLVLGGSSELAVAIVRELQARAPREAMLLGRDPGRLEAAAAELRAAGCERVLTGALDALDIDGHERALAATFERLGGADLVILAAGVLGERGGLPRDMADAIEVLSVNVLGCGSLLLRCAERLRAQGGGALVVLSSAAAERPRRSNAVYGASKAGLDALAQGIGDAVREDGVHVLVARPGFVPTKMTRGLRPMPFATTPQAVARAVVDGLERGAHTVWAPRVLRFVMGAMRLVPRPIFRRLNL
jgi:decaprenylphospho-beta-D-erythro-pentofuranosid-2-ulose 2-reductase